VKIATIYAATSLTVRAASAEKKKAKDRGNVEMKQDNGKMKKSYRDIEVAGRPKRSQCLIPHCLMSHIAEEKECAQRTWL